MIPRRGFIAAVGTTALAGCTGLLGGSTDGGSGSSGGSGGLSLIDSLTRTWNVPEDEVRGQEFELDQSGRIDYTVSVRDGPAVDVYVMDASEYDHLINGDRFQFIPAASDEDTTYASERSDLPGGRYAFVVDNTRMGEAAPPSNLNDDIARVDVELELYG